MKTNILVSRTATKDCSFTDNYGKVFNKNPKNYGICPIDLVWSYHDTNGHLYKFVKHVDCQFNEGVLKYRSERKSIVINTNKELINYFEVINEWSF
jgi:hypothetical protein